MKTQTNAKKPLLPAGGQQAVDLPEDLIRGNLQGGAPVLTWPLDAASYAACTGLNEEQARKVLVNGANTGKLLRLKRGKYILPSQEKEFKDKPLEEERWMTDEEKEAMQWPTDTLSFAEHFGLKRTTAAMRLSRMVEMGELVEIPMNGAKGKRYTLPELYAEEVESPEDALRAQYGHLPWPMTREAFMAHTGLDDVQARNVLLKLRRLYIVRLQEEGKGVKILKGHYEYLSKKASQQAQQADIYSTVLNYNPQSVGPVFSVLLFAQHYDLSLTEGLEHLNKLIRAGKVYRIHKDLFSVRPPVSAMGEFEAADFAEFLNVDLKEADKILRQAKEITVTEQKPRRYTITPAQLRAVLESHDPALAMRPSKKQHRLSLEERHKIFAAQKWPMEGKDIAQLLDITPPHAWAIMKQEIAAGRARTEESGTRAIHYYWEAPEE